MFEPEDLDAHPRLLLAQACEHYGEAVVAHWCAELLAGRIGPGDPASPSVAWIGGGLGVKLRGGGLRPGTEYWPRVWAARGLLYAWAPSASAAVCGGLNDPAWRVREMAAKVIARRELGEAAEALIPAAFDQVARVRAAAVRALGRVAEFEAAEVLRQSLLDADPAVRHRAEAALAELGDRLDRPV